MKILAISNLYPPNAVGGYEALCFDVMQALASRGHEITVLTSNYGNKEEDFQGQRVIRDLTLLATRGNIYEPFACPEQERSRINQENVDFLKATLSSEQPDVVFVWNLLFLDKSFLAAIQETTLRKVFLLTDNWLITFCNPNFIAEYFVRKVYADNDGVLSLLWQLLRKTSPSNGGLPNLLRRMRGYLGGHRRPACSFAGSAIFASRFMQQLYSQAGVSFSEQVVIHHGTVPLPEPPGAKPDRSQLLGKGELRLLFAGRIVKIKGVHTIIEALPLIARQLPAMRICLTILGDDRDQPYVERLQKRIRDLGLEKVVTFSAHVAERDLPGLFHQHDLYLFPSLYEPFALTLIHALRAGIPTVASSAGGTPEIIFHRETGMRFQAGDPADLARQVVALAGSGELRQAISQRSAAHAAGFTFNRMVNDVEAHLTAVAHSTTVQGGGA